jgi:hypothetical protein
MKVQKAREIVIEFEHVRLVRKRCKTHFMLCSKCQADSDFISLTEAASLFTVEREKLLQFIKANSIHYNAGSGGEIYVCLVSFLASMKTRAKVPQMKMIGDKK